jgi:hypothetical protein
MPCSFRLAIAKGLPRSLRAAGAGIRKGADRSVKAAAKSARRGRAADRGIANAGAKTRPGALFSVRAADCTDPGQERSPGHANPEWVWPRLPVDESVFGSPNITTGVAAEAAEPRG